MIRATERVHLHTGTDFDALRIQLSQCELHFQRRQFRRRRRVVGGVDPVALLESHLASGWAYGAVIIIDAPIGEVSRWLPTHLGRLEALDDHTTRLVGSTSDPAMYAQGLAYSPAPFRVQDGDEVRAAVLTLGQRLLAAGGISGAAGGPMTGQCVHVPRAD